MQLKKYSIKLDTQKSWRGDYIEVVAGDYDTNQFEIELTQNSEPYPLEGLNVEIAFSKPDNTTVVQDANTGVSISEGKILCTLSSNTIAAAGRARAEVRVLEGNKVLTSAQFYFYVRKPIMDAETVKSHNEYPALQRALIEAKEAADTLPEINATIESIRNAESDLNQSISQASDMDDTLKGTIQAAGQAKQAIEQAVGDAEADATVIVQGIADSVELAGTAKHELDTSINASATAKTNLDNSVSQAAAAKTQLEGTITQASNAKGQVDDSVSQAGTVKTELEGSIATAGQVKEALDESIQTGDLEAFRNDYNQFKNDSILKTTIIEKEFNDYKAAIAGMNPNQEPKQKVNGYGIIPLPKNAANGQVSVTVKGNTETDEEGNTKSTISAFRIRSVSEDESQESVVYVLAKDDEGNIEELRSLPNGTKDEVRVSESKIIIRNKKYILQATDISFISRNTGSWGIDTISLVALPSQDTNITGSNNVTGKAIIGNLVEFPFNKRTEIASTITQPMWYVSSAGIFVIATPLNYFSSLEEARQQLSGLTLTYQLATPIEIPIQVSGSIVSYPNGTIYVEPFVADAGVYADKIEVLHQDLPIKAIEQLYKVDFMTGIEVPLDVGEVEIDESGLSFTHPDLSEGDIVFFEYEYDVESTQGEAEVEYYDSRYTIKDSVTDKFYKWNVTVADGVPSIEIVEV